jgi:DNA-binding CsgD family transcriptional regulator
MRPTNRKPRRARQKYVGSPMADALTLGRQFVAERRWADAYRELGSANDERPLALEDLEHFANAAYMCAAYDDCDAAWTRAHQEWLQQGDIPRAAHAAFSFASGLVFRDEFAPAMGWIARGRTILESGPDCSERAWLLILTGLPMMFMGDPASAHPMFVEAIAVADRFDDIDIRSLARLACGQSLVMQRQPREGLAMLDEVMVAATAGELSPLVTGISYCAVIDTCQRIFDLRRAREWTAALTRWCASQPQDVPFRGNCLIHRCEVMQIQGEWGDALDAALLACKALTEPIVRPMVGSAYYQLGEIHRRRGAFVEAEDAYTRASDAGRQPQPGHALLRLAQGRIDAAQASIRRVLDETADPGERSKIIPAYVEIMLAAGDVPAARSAADELSNIAEAIDAAFLRGVSAHAAGSVLLAEGDARGALLALRRASAAWTEVDAPHEAARTRELIASACRAVGDDDTADMELAAACRAFEQLGAAGDLARLRPASGDVPGGLSPREVEVLVLVASGKTNRAIANELVLSEKTVARHMSNIFTKLGISSRAAATAYAYEHGLV